MTEADLAWDAGIRHASMSDSRSRCGASWVPPVEELLWRTARASTLVRFFPFSSHNSLRLATSSDFFATAAYLRPCIVYCYDDFDAPDRRPEYLACGGSDLKSIHYGHLHASSNHFRAVNDRYGSAHP
ncbi:hypothetical protein [Streptomyces sp. NPDC089795]|uniref:hypothetical protein n=1 Tax=Streptomyces sp. NPDC089795 TaxID=3155297 RepID=UPI00341DF2E5